MTVELWSVTPDAETLLVKIARRSSDRPNDTDTRLLSYCMRHNHVSVFEHAHLTFYIETTRAISPQLLRHRSFTFQEFSQRYAKVRNKPVFSEARGNGTKNRQSSQDNLGKPIKVTWWWFQNIVWTVAYLLYKTALKVGVAKEVARTLLPTMAPTDLCMTGNVRSWVHYCAVRSQKDTQLEHREISDIIWRHMRENFPVVSKAAEEVHEVLRDVKD